MITFLLSVAMLIGGYFIYGSIVEKIFGADSSRTTPAIEKADNVDFIPLSWLRSFLIQLLNIAGTGPIFGAIAGALWGPVALLWIVFGCIFAGAVHDYHAGMLSVRNNGKTIGDIVGEYLGTNAKQAVRVISIILLLLIGSIFISSPIGILTNMTGINANIWFVIVITYYVIATILPINKIIGKLYPIFGASMLIMCVGIGGSLLFNSSIPAIPEMRLENLHPNNLSIFPFLFISIACGAISGFHATQSPLIARCIQNESQGRRVFYGAMISEGVIALIWATAAMTLFGGSEGLLALGAAPVVVNTICNELLGPFGAILAILGVVICPITSGDTAFRSARLAIADAFKLEQVSLKNRFIVAIPLFAIGIVLATTDFGVLWRYASWTNQVVAAIFLWTSAVYLAQNGKFHWIVTLPAIFMTTVSGSYIVMAPEGLQMPSTVGFPVGLTLGLIVFVLFMLKINRPINIKAENAA